MIYSSIDDYLGLRKYSKKIITEFYKEWTIRENFFIYSFENNSAQGSNKIFIDANLIDLKNLLSKIKGVISPVGVSPNRKFLKFKQFPTDRSGALVSCGWKFQFEFKDAIGKFLDICEIYSLEGIASAENLVKSFEIKNEISTTKTRSIESRVGQSNFRKNLINYWGSCAITGIDIATILKASHIKPWSLSNSTERLDIFNGLLLAPNFDELFDSGLISFMDSGLMVISPMISLKNKELLGIDKPLKLRKMNGATAFYLNFHRENIFKK